MTDEPNPSVAGYIPPPIPDREQRLMIAVELSVIRTLVAAGALTIEGMQQVNHQLALPAVISPALAQTSGLREVVVSELHDALMRATGVELRYWAYPHQVDVPDDLADLADPPEAQ